MEYGKKKLTRSGSSGHCKATHPLTMDDLMFVKDPRSLSGKKKKKKQMAKFLPQSWPSGTRKSKNSRNSPGEKKNHIAVKRRERMLQRGVGLKDAKNKWLKLLLKSLLERLRLHTRGFGSKMMAKMGFIEGGGL